MRVMMLVLTGVVALGFGYSEAFAAKRSSSSTTNPDRQYYQGAATCGGGAACYRSGSQKRQKAHKTAKSN
jgi:hypothetical protein